MIVTYVDEAGILKEVRLNQIDVKRASKKDEPAKYVLTFTMPPTRGFVTVETNHFSIINEA